MDRYPQSIVFAEPIRVRSLYVFSVLVALPLVVCLFVMLPNGVTMIGGSVIAVFSKLVAAGLLVSRSRTLFVSQT